MTNSGADYVERMRAKGLDSAAIKEKLKAAGWSAAEITEAFTTDGETPPPPPSRTTAIEEKDEPRPISVVQRYSTFGIEYGVMMISLAIGAFALASVAHSYLDVLFSKGEEFENPLAVSAAIIALPIFALLFIRLKRAEKRTPALKEDPSRRRWVQVALLLSFLIGIFHLIFYVFNLINGQPLYYYMDTFSQNTSQYQLLQFLHLAITLVIAGGIFAYYWIDEHKQKR